MTQEASPQKERNTWLQDLGTQLVNHMHTYLRSLQLYHHDNDIFRRPLHQMEQIINEVIQREGEFSLFGEGSTILLNDTVLRFPFAMLPSVHYLLKLWAEKDAGGFSIEHAINQTQLQEFLQLFSKEAPPIGHRPQLQGVIRTESLKRVRMRLNKSPLDELQQLTALKADPKQYAILLYSRLLQLVQRSLSHPDPYEPANNNQIIRTLQELIDLCNTQKMRFLGFTNEMDPRAYEAYHICNTVFFSILFGWHLGLDRIQLLDLGRAAVQHNRGKRHLTLELLDKPTPLSPAEQREIRQISVYTVEEILKGPFSWDKLRQAVVTSGIYEPGRPLAQTPRITRDTHHDLPALGSTPPPPPRNQPTSRGPWLYSHIIRLSSTFDALCTRRPFRIKLFPVEALKLMQDHLDHQFDPYLLQRFLDFFAPVAITNRQNPHEEVQLPQDPRPPHSHSISTSPFGHTVQEELQQYWNLRSQRKRSPQDEKRMQALRQTIAQRITTAPYDAFPPQE